MLPALGQWFNPFSSNLVILQESQEIYSHPYKSQDNRWLLLFLFHAVLEKYHSAGWKGLYSHHHPSLRPWLRKGLRGVLPVHLAKREFGRCSAKYRVENKGWEQLECPGPGNCYRSDSGTLQGIHEAIRQCWLEDATKIIRCKTTCLVSSQLEGNGWRPDPGFLMGGAGIVSSWCFSCLF